MKRITALIIIAALLTCAAAFGEDSLSFRSLAGLDQMALKLDAGVRIDRVYYTDGYGFSTSEFTTTDPEEISLLWSALNRITVKGRVDESVTDWYPQIIFDLSDGTTAHVTFESHWLSLPDPWPQANYALENDSDFWHLTASLVSKYESSVHPRDAWWDGSLEGRFRVGVKEAAKDHLTLSLWTEDLYSRDQIENLQPGDTVTVRGKTYTVAVMKVGGYYDSDGDGTADESLTMVRDLEKNRELLDRHELVVDRDASDAPAGFETSSYELIPEEDFDGYIAFQPVSDDECTALVNDWSPCTRVGSTTVQLPLPEGFVFEDDLDDETGAREFLDDVSVDWYTPYNTIAWFENGLLARVSHSDYPAGPED